MAFTETSWSWPHMGHGKIFKWQNQALVTWRLWAMQSSRPCLPLSRAISLISLCNTSRSLCWRWSVTSYQKTDLNHGLKSSPQRAIAAFHTFVSFLICSYQALSTKRFLRRLRSICPRTMSRNASTFKKSPVSSTILYQRVGVAWARSLCLWSPTSSQWKDCQCGLGNSCFWRTDDSVW